MTTDPEVGQSARSAGVADRLLAAIAEIEGLTLLHHDAEWVAPRGSIP